MNAFVENTWGVARTSWRCFISGAGFFFLFISLLRLPFFSQSTMTKPRRPWPSSFRYIPCCCFCLWILIVVHGMNHYPVSSASACIIALHNYCKIRSSCCERSSCFCTRFRRQTRRYQTRQVKILSYVLKPRSAVFSTPQGMAEYLTLLLRILQFPF